MPPIKRSITLASIAAATVIPTQAVAAGPPSPASGTVTPQTSVLTAPPRFADNNLFLKQHETLAIAGTITGSIDQRESIVVHADGSAEVQGFGTITGAFGSCGTGTVPIEITARVTPAGSLTGHLVSIDRSDNTLGVHLHLDVSSIAIGFAYSGFIFCGP